ncbi:hypothetical protein [Desulfurivibrio alkaliphilus]|uniref:Uncharacterized protein n=1 Tax=Desulfurivibrio alkaliphilus (strain DSM 19089 / UNIQEM U267 / AHT2) TaxID=589865 RepID=D6Z040_DESAT|nr:hypothetical protein [Desulfurivibrio alkaliphilus]ADH87073.1 hypothetical protein DaAHT2_2408 [Desulfurivibrio alkaliphilus AHT 2]
MKILHVYRSEPDGDTKKLVEIVSEGREAAEFKLFEGQVDYDKLVDMVMDADKSICWW